MPDAGLSRYFDLGTGPGAGSASPTKRTPRGRTHYDRAREYYRTHDVTDYDEALYYDSARDQLTDLFYKGDRSMRESGFDPSNRFGALNVDVIHYAPVCLNTLLYIMEDDAARIMDDVGGCGGGTELASSRGRDGVSASTGCCGTSRPACTTTTTSGLVGFAIMTLRRRSIRCGPASLRKRKPRGCAETCPSSKRPAAC